jgi:hypothetical protein
MALVVPVEFDFKGMLIGNDNCGPSTIIESLDDLIEECVFLL